MDIQVLKNFLMVAREKNITRASEILHISQPTLSRQIQNLEEEFGQKLFYRNNKKVSLTVYGNMLQRRAEEIVSLYEQTQSEIKPDAGVVLGEIRIAVCEASSVDDIYSLGKQFQQEHPLTVLSFFNTSSDQASDMIENGTADFGLLFGYADEKRFDSHRVSREEKLGILMLVGHPLSEKEALEIEDLKGYPLIAYQDAVRGVSYLYEAGYLESELKATFTTLTSAMKMVERGIGISTVLCSMIEGEIDTGIARMVTRPMKSLHTVPTFLAWKKNVVLSQQASLFLELLKENM